MANIYPSFTPKAQESLKLLQQLLIKNPDALALPECPYPKGLKDALNVLLVIGATRSDPKKVEELIRLAELATKGKEIQEQKKMAEALDDDIDIERESKQLYNTISSKMKQTQKMDNNEQLQLFRTATTLLEKLLIINERATSLSQFQEFKSLVIEGMERYLTPAQKTEFIDTIAETLEDS